jgi:4-amino-4-deoxy-L-arabinose transferase-like glycosyltransferase
MEMLRPLAALRNGAAVLPRWLVLFLFGSAFALLLGLPTLIIPFSSDNAWFALGARTLLDGDQLYSDYWDQKPPMIYFVYALPFALVGEHMEAVRALDLLNTLAVMAVLFALGRRLFGERSGVFAAGLYGFTYLAWTGVDGLGETESFLSLPLLLAVLLYRADDRPGSVAWRALASGVLLGVAFAFKTSVALFVLALPLAELLLRGESWTKQGAISRLALAAMGFLVVQIALTLYLAVVGALGDFIDIQRNYSLPYSSYRWAPASSSPHVRFLLQATAERVRDTPFLVVPAVTALFFALHEARHARAVYYLAALAGLGVLSIWWQGKMFRYHWLIMLPLLAPLAGYTLDRALALFALLPGQRMFAAVAVLSFGMVALAFQPLLNVYDNYRTLISYVDGSIDRRDVEARYVPLYRENHELVDYVRSNGDDDDVLFIWGVWPTAYFWLDHPLLDRFIVNSGLRADWSPEDWRIEFMADMLADPPRFFAVARGDNQPWLNGNSETSEGHLRNGNFPELSLLLEQRYRPVFDNGLFLLYELRPAVA